MSFLSRAFLSLAILIPTTGSSLAQEPSAWIEELRAMRKTIEQQNEQLKALKAEVARLAEAVRSPEGGPPTAVKESAPAEEFGEAPKAEAIVRPTHIVVKGDTFTSIAKRYNLTVPELQKANKDVKERSLQIGQSIVIPEKPDAKSAAPESPTHPTEHTEQP
ncbi:MAG: LysM peptidoglycan-binding domain-containing protein [Chthoniobacteraceae bacterium]